MTDMKLRQGTTAWFEMVGMLICEAASRAGLASDFNLSPVELHTDGLSLCGGFVQGLRFDIRNGIASFWAGARLGEEADIRIEITSAAAGQLNSLYSADPRYQAALERFLSTGQMRVDGDPTQIGSWLQTVNDTIFDRTIQICCRLNKRAFLLWLPQKQAQPTCVNRRARSRYSSAPRSRNAWRSESEASLSAKTRNALP